jgi:hypothetical protein
VCGEGGLGKVTLTQLLFQINHVIQRDFDAFKVLNVENACDCKEDNLEDFLNDVDGFVKFSEMDGAANKFKKSALARWVTLCEVCLKLARRLNLIPCRAFEDKVAVIYGGFDSEEYQNIRNECCCHSSADPSLLKLIFVHLANHSPGGRKEQGYNNYMQIIGALNSPHVRLAIEFTCSLEPFYKHCSKFYDGSSNKINSLTATFSTRFLELSVFNRGTVLPYFRTLGDEYKTRFPEFTAYLHKEDTKHPTENLIEYFEVLVKEPVSRVYNIFHAELIL